ncbi:MAG: ClbS/DfsB family four-helix bundle protein [Cytophagaceae bacterium]|nr:ClbS/DfsB family four-helix bundle protein [Cytophagaceae bacterium]
MARPTSKIELLNQSEGNFKKLMALVESTKNPDQEFFPGTMNRNIRDVLAHLHHWHLMMIDWYTVGMSGQTPEIPAKGYTWKTTPRLNRKIWEDYQGTVLEEVKEKLFTSHVNITTLIEKHSNDELFEKKRYRWTGTTSLGAYFIGATSSHYDWALKLIKKGLM